MDERRSSTRGWLVLIGAVLWGVGVFALGGFDHASGSAVIAIAAVLFLVAAAMEFAVRRRRSIDGR